jgi:hypothetical protein
MNEIEMLDPLDKRQGISLFSMLHEDFLSFFHRKAIQYTVGCDMGTFV